MEFTAKVYFDDILQDNKDISNLLENFKLSIKRESSFSSGENILRESSDLAFDVKGCSYDYLCSKFTETPCDDVKVYFELNIHGEMLTFNGIIRLSAISWLKNKRIAKIKAVKDSSFSGLIQSFLSTKIPLYNTKTQNCVDIELKNIFINTPTVPNTYVITNIFAFDVLDVFKYIVGFFTDNEVTVKSDYLTNNKYAIATGFCMHNNSLPAYERYPELSFSELIGELYKKLNIKMIVEYETDGTPYLRIEEEDYMFEDVSLLELSDTFDMETYLDVKKIFNDVLAGSNTTKLVDKGNLIYKQLPIVSWRKETILSCGSCVGEKNNKINLVSDYVIDANIIHEAMITPIGNDYDSDDNIFLLNYYFDGFENKLVGNNTLKYNVNINNENVINNFLGASSECLILSRYTQDYFKVEQQSFLETIAGASFQTSVADAVTFSDTISDNNNVINDTPSQVITYNRYLPYPISPVSNTGNASFTHYKCSKNGNYNLVVDLIRMSLSSAFNISGVDLTYFIHLVHYTDDTFTTVINQYTVSETVTDFQTIVDLTLETGLININVGECCLVVFELGYDYNQLGTVATTNFDFTADNFIFYMKGSEFTCEDIQDESDKFRPYVVEFSRPLNACDYNKLKANPKGYINIDGNKCYIEEVNYSLQKTDFKLITNKIIC